MSDLKPTTVGLAISMPILATAAVVLRFRARILKKQKFLQDDWLALAASIFCLGLSAAALTAVFRGNLGGHLLLGPGSQAQDPDSYVALGKAFWALQLICVPAVGLAKLSILFFYKRIFFIEPAFRVLSWAMVGLIIAWNITFFFFNMLDCLPIEVNWRTSAGADAKCVPISYVFWSQVVSDIVTDFMILLLPWPYIWRLHLSKGQKFQIGGVFLLGFFVVGAGIARCVLTSRSILSKTRDLDYTYTRAPSVYWLIVEADVGVISTCLPVLRPLIMETRLGNFSSRVWRALSSGKSHSSVSESDHVPSGLNDSRPLYERKTEQAFPDFHMPPDEEGQSRV